MPTTMSTSRSVRPLRWLAVAGSACVLAYLVGASGARPASTSTPAPAPASCTAVAPAAK